MDVFTDRLFGGNQLAVLPDARGLSDRQMQAIAQEMNFAETTFVLPPERPDTDVRMRIFTPGREMPMAGHPTIGSTFALARAGAIAPSKERFVFGLNVGPIPVALTWSGDELAFVWMTQLRPAFGGAIDDIPGAAAMLGVSEESVSAQTPIQIVSCGIPCLLVPMATRRDVDEAALDRLAYDAFVAPLDHRPTCLFFFSVEPGADGATAYSRMFAPELGIGEDAATGAASGPLGCYLVAHGLVDEPAAAAMWSLQGVKMGRPSHVHMSIAVEQGEIVRVRVGGESVSVGDGFLYV